MISFDHVIDTKVRGTLDGTGDRSPEAINYAIGQAFNAQDADIGNEAIDSRLWEARQAAVEAACDYYAAHRYGNAIDALRLHWSV